MGTASGPGQGSESAAAGDTAGDPPPGFDMDTRTRTQWQRLIAICNKRNYTSCKDIDKTRWTDATKSVISELSFAGLGAWSTFKISSLTAQGMKKSTGGDTWFITLRDEEQRLK